MAQVSMQCPCQNLAKDQESRYNLGKTPKPSLRNVNKERTATLFASDLRRRELDCRAGDFIISGSRCEAFDHLENRDGRRRAFAALAHGIEAIA
jgi:hypothetical protein